MSYHIYTTRGLILHSFTRREADRTYVILTRDLGLIYATAIGVRKELSKLRGSLEPLSLSNISLVKGKEAWRLTSAELVISLSKELRNNKSLLRAYHRIFALLQKLVVGENIHPEILDEIEKVARFTLSESLNPDEILAVEIVLISRILFELGYLSTNEVSAHILKSEITRDLLVETGKMKSKIIASINEGIKISGLG
jgi:recombinational DNA repair protein (RecF pathway)